jgi:GNAT superfamily N-acetyltransferase
LQNLATTVSVCATLGAVANATGRGSGAPAGLTIRPRAGDDMDALVELAATVQVADGYPGRRPLDLAAFLAASDAMGAWVAERQGAIVGHVALHRTSLPVVMERAAAHLGRPASELAVVARLIVDPGSRRAGVGRALLTAAADEARRRGRHPILDVVTAYDAAVRLYEACGWHSTGEVEMRFRDGTTLQSFVYVAPG